MQEIYELDVYCLAEKLSDMVWDDYDDWPSKAQHTTGYQVIRSADSIAANISEGYGRRTTPDRLRFYIYARGSFEETKCWLRKAHRRRLFRPRRTDEYAEIINELGPKLNGFIRSTCRQSGVAEEEAEYDVQIFTFETP